MRDDSRHQAPDDVLFCGIEEQIVHLLGIVDAVEQDMVLEFGGIFAPALSPASTDIGQLVFGRDYAGWANTHAPEAEGHLELGLHRLAVLGQDDVGLCPLWGRRARQFLGIRLGRGSERNGEEGSDTDKRFENLHVGAG